MIVSLLMLSPLQMKGGKMMINLFNDIPYDPGMPGNRFIVDREDLRIVQVALMPGQKIPEHITDGNVSLLVLTGNLDLTVGADTFTAVMGSIIIMPEGTRMQAENVSPNGTAFLITKTPLPGTKLGVAQ